jgi:hypothetical protein
MIEDRKVTREDANSYASNLKMAYYDTSAKTGVNVQDCFQSLAKKLKEGEDKGKVDGYLHKGKNRPKT